MTQPEGNLNWERGANEKEQHGDFKVEKHKEWNGVSELENSSTEMIQSEEEIEKQVKEKWTESRRPVWHYQAQQHMGNGSPRTKRGRENTKNKTKQNKAIIEIVTERKSWKL